MRLTPLLFLGASLLFSIAPFLFKDIFQKTAALGLLGLFIVNLISSATFFTAAPANLTVVAEGAVYSPLLVAIIASLGSALGDMLSFAVGASGRRLANHKLAKRIWFGIVSEYFRKYGGLSVLLFAFIPNPVFDSIGIVAGIFAYSPLRFFTLVLAGRFLRYFLLASFGSII